MTGIGLQGWSIGHHRFVALVSHDEALASIVEAEEQLVLPELRFPWGFVADGQVWGFDPFLLHGQ